MIPLSIITVVKDRSESVAATINSLISQKSDLVEYILIDGASSDGTLERIEKYRSDIDILISEPDNGIYDAINKGIKLSSGKYIGLLHAGDTLLPGVISRILDEIEKSNDEILYGCIKIIESSSNFYIWGFSVNELPRKMIPHPAIFVPRSIYERFGFYDVRYRIAADYDLLLKYYYLKLEFKFIDLIVCNFGLNGISSIDQLTFKETIEIRQKYGINSIDQPTLKETIEIEQKYGIQEYKNRVLNSLTRKLRKIFK